MTDRELMQQALDALESECDATKFGAAEAIRARLEQPEPEPVAWFMEGTFEDGAPSFTQVCETDPEFYVPLYTTPPQREWQGLTDEEIDELFLDHMEELFHGRDYDYERAIEAKLKEKNHG